MRSELVFQALIQVTNPFYLCQLISRASRSLHQKEGFASAQVINEALSFSPRSPRRERCQLSRVKSPTHRFSLLRCGLLPRAGLTRRALCRHEAADSMWTKSGGFSARSGHACLECAGQIDPRLLHSPCFRPGRTAAHTPSICLSRSCVLFLRAELSVALLSHFALVDS